MKIQGTPGPHRIKVTFEEGKFKGKSVIMDAEPLVGGILLYANTIHDWNGGHIPISPDEKFEIVNLIKNELNKFPPSEII